MRNSADHAFAEYYRFAARAERRMRQAHLLAGFLIGLAVTALPLSIYVAAYLP